MGKKVNPKVIRLGIIKTWPSKWFKVGDDYIKSTRQDVELRKYVIKNYKEAGIDKVEIARDAKRINVDIHTAKPGLIIGRGGTGIDDLKKTLHRKFLKNFRPNEIQMNVKEVSRPNLSAQIVLQSMILDIEKRMPFRRVMKQAISRVERAGAQGVKIVVAGRLNGAEIARTEKLVSGKVPLQTLRADIDYSRGGAYTTYGIIGIKVWIYRGEVFSKDSKDSKDEAGQVIGDRQK
jgi:small subunit ribosomal protein S3